MVSQRFQRCRHGAIEIDCRCPHRIREAWSIARLTREREQQNEDKLRITGTLLELVKLQGARLELG